MRVLLAPDSFKGSATAARVAEQVRSGWLEVRPDDEVVTLPLADGGEGTLDAVGRSGRPVSEHRVVVDGPAGVASVPWLLLPDGTAVVELAAACGLPLWPAPDPLGAHTYALGQVMAAAAHDRRVNRVVVALGGSASTDGGVGALAALGARFLDAEGACVAPGGKGLLALSRVDLTTMVRPPRGGVQLLLDVEAPLLGPDGAAAVFGPQKGATPHDVRLLEEGLGRLARVLGGAPQTPGAGAAGGTAYGLMAAWGALPRRGSVVIGDLVGLAAAVRGCDLVVTGEGRLDSSSTRGKVVGHVARTARAEGVEVWACVGQAESGDVPGVAAVTELRELAGSAEAALAGPEAWLREAGRRMAAAAAGAPARR